MRLVHKLALLAVTAAAVTTGAAPSAFPQVSGTEPLEWPAPATSKLEISSEQTGTMCPAVTPDPPPMPGNYTTGGGCFVHITGTEMNFSFHLDTGMEMSAFICNIEADLRISNKGLGYLTHQEVTPHPNHASACTRRPCHYPNTPFASYVPPTTRNGMHNEARPWRIKAREIAFQSEVFTVLFCLEDRATTSLEPTPKFHCEVTLTLTEKENGVPANHRYNFSAVNVAGTGMPRCELNGSFDTEMTQMQTPVPVESARGQIEINHVP